MANGVITGVVRYNDTGVADAKVYVIDAVTSEEVATAITDSEGQYLFDTLELDVRYHLTVEWFNNDQWFSGMAKPNMLAEAPAPPDVGPNGEYIGGSDGTVPLAFDTTQHYENDAAWRGQILYQDIIVQPTWIYDNTALNGTGGAQTARYTDGRYVDLAVWQDTIKILGNPAWEFTIVAENDGASSPTAEFSTPLSSAVEQIWLFRRTYYPAGFTNVGDGDSSAAIAFNGTQAAGFKNGPYGFFGNGVNGRAGASVVNEDLIIQNTPQVGGSGYGIGETRVANIAPQYTDGEAWDWLMLLESWAEGGKNYVGSTLWRKLAADPLSSYQQLGSRLAAETDDSLGIVEFARIGMSGLNYNQSRSTDLKWYMSDWAAFAFTDGGDDPFGRLAAQGSVVAQVSSVDIDSVDLSGDFIASIEFSSLSLGKNSNDEVGLGIVEYNVDGGVYSSAGPIPLYAAGDPVLFEIAAGLAPGTYDVRFRTVSPDGQTIGDVSDPVEVVVTGGGPSAAPLTSVGNGFISGANFSATSNSADVRTAIQGIGTTNIYNTPSNVTYNGTDATFGKICRVAEGALFEGLMTDDSLDTFENVRLRVVERYTGFDVSDIENQQWYKIWNATVTPTPSVYIEPKNTGVVLLESSGTYSGGASSVNTLANDLIDGTWKEVILEWIRNTDGTVTANYYQQAYGSSRTPKASFTSPGGVTPTMVWNAWRHGSLGTVTGSVRDIALIEICDARDGSGDLIPVSALGT